MIAYHAAKTWTLKKEDRRRIDAFKTWVWRKLLRMKILRTVKHKNKSTLQELKELVLGYFRHLVSRDTRNLKKSILFGKISSKNGKG